MLAQAVHEAHTQVKEETQEPVREEMDAFQRAISGVLSASEGPALAGEAGYLVAVMRTTEGRQHAVANATNTLEAIQRLTTGRASLRRMAAECLQLMCMEQSDIGQVALPLLSTLSKSALDDSEDATLTRVFAAEGAARLVSYGIAPDLVAAQFGIPTCISLARSDRVDLQVSGLRVLSACIGGREETELLTPKVLRTLGSMSQRSPTAIRQIAVPALAALVNDDTWALVEKAGGTNLLIELINVALSLPQQPQKSPVVIEAAAQLLRTAWMHADSVISADFNEVQTRSACADGVLTCFEEMTALAHHSLTARGDALSAQYGGDSSSRVTKAAKDAEATATRLDASLDVVTECLAIVRDDLPDDQHGGLVISLACALRIGSVGEAHDAASSLAVLSDEADMRRAIINQRFVPPLIRLMLSDAPGHVRVEAIRALGSLFPEYSVPAAYDGVVSSFIRVACDAATQPTEVVVEISRVLARLIASSEVVKELHWVQPPLRGTPPSPRCGHSGVIWHDQLIVFGGEERADSAPEAAADPESGQTVPSRHPRRMFSDVHVLDLLTMAWRKVETMPAGKSEGEVSVADLAASGFARIDAGTDDNPHSPARPNQIDPSVSVEICATPRTRHTATVVGSRMYVFGGWGLGREGRWRLLDEMLCLDLVNWTWSRPAFSGKSPAPRSGHAAVCQGKSIVVFGGWGSPMVKYNDTHLYHTEEGRWELPVLLGPAAYPSESPGMVALWPSDSVVVFGGATRGTTHASSTLFDLKMHTSTPLPVNSSVAEPRAAHAFHRIGIHHLLAFGGWNAKTDSKLNSVAVLNTAAMQWTAMDPEGLPPSSRSLFVSGVWRGGMVVFGGSDEISRNLGDVHILRIRTGIAHWLMSPHQAAPNGDGLALIEGILAVGSRRLQPAFGSLMMAVDGVSSTDPALGQVLARASKAAGLSETLKSSSESPLTHIYMPAPTMISVNIPASSWHSIRIEATSETRGMILWSVKVDAYDVDLVLARGDTQVYRERFYCNEQLRHGRWIVDQPGDYLFKVDNRYSWLTSKSVQLRVVYIK